MTVAPVLALPHTGAWTHCWKTMLSVKMGDISTLAVAFRQAIRTNAQLSTLFIFLFIYVKDSNVSKNFYFCRL